MTEISTTGHMNGTKVSAKLTEGHLSVLRDSSGISPSVIKERGYWSSTRPGGGFEDATKARLKALGIGTGKLEPKHLYGIVIPVWRAGSERISTEYRPDSPLTIYDKGRTRQQKYLRPFGRPANLDVHPRNKDKILDPTEPLWITEGIKKGDCLTSRGICAVAIPGVWNWRHAHATLGDWEDIELRGRTVVICFDSDTNEKKSVKDAMVRLGRWLKSKGVKTVKYLIVPESVNGTKTKGVDDFFVAGGRMDQLKEAATEKPPKDQTDDRFSDTYMADLAADEAFDGKFVYASGIGWMRWTGVIWKRCEEGNAREAFRLYVIDQLEATARQMKAGDTQAQQDHDGWRKLLGAGRLTSVTGLAKFNEAVAVDAAGDLDKDTDLLNCPNGIVDLRTGELYDHDPERMMTKVSGAEYRPGYTHELWDKALEALPPVVRRWYQLRMGQAIIGEMTPDDLLIVCHGGGRNGKSCILGGTSAAAGDYYDLLSDRVLLANPDAHPTELMDLKGLRYAALEETSEARRLDTQRLKKTIGTSEIKARYIRQDGVTFKSTHTLIINTNHKPIISETDHATWERLALVSFPYTYRKTPEEVQGPLDRLGDPDLRRLCETDPDIRSAALTWMVQGAIDYYTDGGSEFRAIPAPVVADTLEWRKESDQALAFISDHIRFNPERHVRTDDLRVALGRWLDDKGMVPWNEPMVRDRLVGHEEFVQRGIMKKKTKKSSKLSRPPEKFYESLRTSLRLPADSASYQALHGIELVGYDSEERVNGLQNRFSSTL